MIEKKRAVVVGSCSIKNYKKIKSFFIKDDFFIFCDGGLNHQKKLRVQPDLIVGDFDSHKKPKTKIETIVLPCEKDDTDTIFAVKEAIRRGFTDFLLVGVIGKRLDHSFGNLSILLKLDELNFSGMIIDDFSQMCIASKNQNVEISEEFKFFSVINLDNSAKSVNIKNAKYPLENKEIPCDYQYGISNEVLPGKTACVSLENGRALVIKIW